MSVFPIEYKRAGDRDSATGEKHDRTGTPHPICAEVNLEVVPNRDGREVINVVRVGVEAESDRVKDQHAASDPGRIATEVQGSIRAVGTAPAPDLAP
jgi:hypothetical protein